jgi:probable HAF family extracellular repeat protein
MQSIVSPSRTLFLTFLALFSLGLEVVAQTPPRYRLVDLGALPSRPALSPFFDGISAQSLSQNGTLTGFVETTTPDPFAPFCFQEDCLVAHAFRWRNGVLTDLASLAGPGFSSVAFWTSGNGLIAGLSQNGKINPLIPDLPEFRAVFWQAGKIADLGTLDGGSHSGAFAINNVGQVVGFSTNAIADPNPSLLTETIGDPELHAVLWEHRQIKDLGTLESGTDSVALLINDRGHVVGQSYTDDRRPPTPSCGFPQNLHGFMWEKGIMRDIGTLGGSCTFTYALNNRGQIVGQSSLAGDAESHPYIWDPERGLTDLFSRGGLGGSYGYAQWINDAGTVVGTAATHGNAALLAVQWTDDAVENLGALAGDPCSATDAINSRGQVVGGSGFFAADFFPECNTTVEHAVLWDHGTKLDLNTFVPPDTDLTLNEATFINDRGEITGFAVDSKGAEHAFLLLACNGESSDCLEGSLTGNGQREARTRDFGSAPTTNWRRSLAVGRHLPKRAFPNSTTKTF